MKKWLSVFSFLFFASCSIQYEGDERLIVTGRLADSFNNPIAGANMETHTYIENGYLFGNSTDLISFTKTDENGNFKMSFPKPVDYQNTKIDVIANNTLQEKNFRFINLSDFSDYKLDLGIIKLYQENETSALKITLNQMNNWNQIVKIQLIGDIAEDEIWINSPHVEYDYNNLFIKKVAKNQLLTVKYKVKNSITDVVSLQETNIIIGNDDTTLHTIDY